MEQLDKLTRTDMNPHLLAQVRALFAEKDFMSTALTQELAYYRRVRFGKASEALGGQQRMLFECG